MRRRKASPLDLDGDGKVADDVAKISTGVIVAVVIVLLIAAAWGSYARPETNETVVRDKGQKCSRNADGDMDCKYLVYTDRGTYAVEDSMIAFRWDSSDVYGRIPACHRVKITSIDLRIPAFSTYPNITGVEDLGRVDGCERCPTNGRPTSTSRGSTSMT